MKKLILLAALLLFSSSWSKAQTNDSSAKPPMGMSEIEAYSIFYENYRSKSYESALKFGRWIWKGMPETIKGYPRFDLKKNIGRLVECYSEVAKKKQDPSVKRAYVDTAMLVFDNALEKFSDANDVKYDWYIKRGRMYQTHSSLLNNATSKAADDYLSAFKINPKEFTNFGDGYYMKVMLQNLVGDGKKDQALAIMKKADPYASEELQSFFNEQRKKLFDSPKEQMTFLENRLKEEPKNEKVLNELREVYKDQDMMEKASKISDKLYSINPNFENTMAVANDAISNANYDMAIKYLKEAIGKAKNDQQKAEISLKLSEAYLNKGSLETARKYARQAADLRPDWGQPYLKIADIYAEAVNQCTNDRKLDRKDKVVYWLVLDMLDKAKQVDKTTSNEVDRKYKAYSSVLPTTEEKFFWQPPLKKGDKFKIGSSLRKCYGWINQTTNVR